MAFDVDGYRKAAKAAGIPDSEIENEIKFQTSAPAKTDPFEKDEGGFKIGTAEQIQERIGNDWWHLPAGLAVLGAAATGLKALMGGDADDPNDPSNRPTYRFDPKLDVEPIDQQPMQPVKPQQTNLTPQDLEARAAQLKAPVAPGATPTVAELDAAFAAQNPISTPITAAPIDAPAPTPSAAPNSPVTSIVTDTVKEMIQETPAQPPEAAKPPVAAPVAPPAYPKAGTNFKTEADIPPGFVARYDVGNLDRSMGNILGLEHRANARDLFNQGKPFGQSANLNQDVSDLTKRYFQQLQSEIPETLLGREARQAQKIPSEFGVFAKNTPFGTGVKIGGKAATLFALADVANAAQQGNYGGAALQAADIATDYLPFVGQIKQALSPSSAGAGSDIPPNMAQAMLLGSPYAQTPLAVKRRQALEYAAKVGSGRGLTPASAYPR